MRDPVQESGTCHLDRTRRVRSQWQLQRSMTSCNQSGIITKAMGNYDSPRFGELSKESKYRDGFSWENCLFDKALESPWETIYFNDRMVKHEVRPFHREAGRSGPCHRDVIVNFVRKPLSDGSDFRHCEDEDEDSEDQ